jgi:hypothetical protein
LPKEPIRKQDEAGREVVPEVVALLERLLQAARRGELVALVGAPLYYDGSSGPMVTGRMTEHYALLGALNVAEAIIRDSLLDAIDKEELQH